MTPHRRHGHLSFTGGGGSGSARTGWQFSTWLAQPHAATIVLHVGHAFMIAPSSPEVAPKSAEGAPKSCGSCGSSAMLSAACGASTSTTSPAGWRRLYRLCHVVPPTCNSVWPTPSGNDALNSASRSNAHAASEAQCLWDPRCCKTTSKILQRASKPTGHSDIAFLAAEHTASLIEDI